MSTQAHGSHGSKTLSDDAHQKDEKNKNNPGDSSGSGGGEDESSTEKNGDDSHLHDNQKSRTLKT